MNQQYPSPSPFEALNRKLIKDPITLTQAKSILKVINKGLTSGLGTPEPGEMCVEAAVCYALGLPHSDNPPCVDDDVSSLKIGLNDLRWSSRMARAKGMKRVAIAQLGTNKKSFNYKRFEKYMVFNGVKFITCQIFELLVSSLSGEIHTQAKKHYEQLSVKISETKTLEQITTILRKDGFGGAYSNRFVVSLCYMVEIAEHKRFLFDMLIVLSRFTDFTIGKPLDKIYSGYADIFVEALGAGNAEGYKLLKKLK